ncbi:hypothetical protein [Bacillus seohaeanensis]|jgi:hypothetical protein|uniref:Spore coat protein n=1 Tax=Bacillus seohaeanensis TaxID=284580 RepID=A0ABW5RPJ1_9BACI
MYVNHNLDYDRDGDREDIMSTASLKNVLESAYKVENDLMRNYITTAEKIHDNKMLKERLQNFAEGNAKRLEQLKDEVENL